MELVPKFYPEAGKHLEAEWWVEEIEKTFTALEVPEHKKVDYATYVLREDANNWWSSTRNMAGGPMTWDQFKQAFYMKFFPANIRQQMLQDFYTLQQGNRTVEEYESELSRLMRFLPKAMRGDEEARKGRFLTGLKAQITSVVNNFELTTYAAVVNKAKLVEQGQKKVQEQESSKGQIILGKRPATAIVMQDKGKRPMTHQASAVNQIAGLKCSRCNGPHEVKDCKWVEGTCFDCGKTGYSYKNCTERSLPQVFYYKCS